MIFDSSIGILIGDTASPELWLLYFADFFIPESDDDLNLDGAYVSHLEQASARGLLGPTSVLSRELPPHKRSKVHGLHSR